MKSVYFLTKDSVVIEVWNEEFNPEILYISFEFKYKDNVVFNFSVQDVENLLVLLQRGSGTVKDSNGLSLFLVDKSLMFIQTDFNSRSYLSVSISGLSLTNTLKKWLGYRS